MDGNAWDLFEGDDDSSSVQQPKRSSSNVSGTEQGNVIDLNAEEITQLIDEERKEKERGRRSKSPAVDSLRKVSKAFLEKVGIKPKKKDTSIPCEKAPELPPVPLEQCCSRPSEFFYHHTKGNVKPSIEKVVSSALLKDKKLNSNAKGSFLFQTVDETAATLGAQPVERVHVYDPFCPVHGSKRHLKHRRLVDMNSFVTSVETVDNEVISPLLYSQGYIAKILRKRKRLNISGDQKIHVEKCKRKIRSNLAIISVAFLFLFTAFNALQNLQTTVNGHLGADSLFAFYIALAVSSLFVPSFVLNRLGSKLTLVTSFGIYILYMIANFLPRYYSLLPISIFTGIASSCLWAAKCVYITESGIKYAKLNIEAQNIVIVRFFGYFFMIVHLSQVVGNVISSYVMTSVFGLRIQDSKVDLVDPTCGHGFVDNETLLSPQAIRNLQGPPFEAYLTIVTVNLCCSIIALLIVVLFLNALKRDEATRLRAPHFTCDVLRLTFKNLRRPKPLLLVPLTVFNGIEQAFVVGLYTKAYVGCGLGVGQIGYVMTAFGVADCFCSLVFGPLIKLFGRMPLFVFGAVINGLMILTLSIWPVNPSDGALFYVVAGVWGMADGVWMSQVNGFWVALVGRHSLEVAFANYRFWISFGLAIGFLLIRFTTIDNYLLVAFSVLLVGILCYLVIELYDHIGKYFKHLFSPCYEIFGQEGFNVDESASDASEILIPSAREGPRV